MTTWSDDIPTVDTVELPPDRRALEALGRNHQLETALADLVDNSIDADATTVLIRFIIREARLVGLYVIDDGRGMNPQNIDTAMTVGGRRAYTDTDLGQFGLGLKAASFSQARALTVLSRAQGQPAVGRRWQLDAGHNRFLCDIVAPSFAASELDRGFTVDVGEHGTVIRWDNVSSFPNSDDATTIYLTRKISAVTAHLGLMFHRLISAGRIQIRIDVEDVTDGQTGPPIDVQPLDPFGYPTPIPGWPRNLVHPWPATNLIFRCHLWPAYSNMPGYKLPGGEYARQGLYFYRRDRLLHAGGWEGVTASAKTLQLARVALDIDGDTAGLFRLNPEKTRITVGPDFATAVAAAHADDGTTMANYLQAAEQAWVDAHRRHVGRHKPVLPPGKGLHDKVRREIQDELPVLRDDPLDIVWERFDAGDERFIMFNFDTNTVRLNARYRPALLGGRRSGLNDLPVLKAALFLLLESDGVKLFHGDRFGARDKVHVELFTQVLTAAAKAERAAHEARR